MGEDRHAARLPASVDALQRELADQAFSRAAGAPLIPGNRVEVLRDAAENYPAWREAIRAAERSIHLEMYIFRDDAVGRGFAELLMLKAREGVAVRLLYDWLGGLGKTPRRFWQQLAAAGVEVRCCNPPRLGSPLGWLRRDHRKMLTVDGAVGFVSGLCIGQDWVGWPDRGVEPWRDTGVVILGPAVADLEEAFAEIWATTGEPLAEAELPGEPIGMPAGSTSLRIVASAPETTGLLRLDLLWAAMARERLWLTDAYFVGTRPYLGALESAARSGVDVRLLVPSTSDVRVVAALSRTQYRSLLEAGVRVFEWQGSMIHAKTAVVDGRWARVGSTNLNLASWMGNWELDVCLESEPLAARMEDDYEDDLERSTEIVLSEGRVAAPPRRRRPRRRRVQPGSASRVAAAAVEISGAVGAVITRRTLGRVEARPLRVFGWTLLALAALGLAVPELLAVPLSLLAAWTGVSLVARARQAEREEARGQPAASRRRGPD